MAVGLARARKVDFSLVTPYVTDAGLERLRKLFSFLSGTGIPIEIIINDWGVLWTVVRDYPRLKPVLGRLLTKQKRCPTIPRLLRRRPRVVCSRDPAAPGLLRVLAEKKLPAEADVYYKGSNAGSVAVLQSYLLEEGVSRIELDNTLQGVMLGLVAGMHASIYVPFVYITTTFYCPTAGCEVKQEDYLKIRPCRKQCRRFTFTLRHKAMNKVIYLKGNTQFYKNRLVALRKLEKNGVDRLVYQPALPF